MESHQVSIQCRICQKQKEMEDHRVWRIWRVNLSEIIFSRKKKAEESVNGLETVVGSCSAGVDE